MLSFETYLKKNQQVGVVKGLSQAYITVEGLPYVKMHELVVFENGALGLVAALAEELVEVMHVDGAKPNLGMKAALTRETLRVKVGDELLGAVVDGLGRPRESHKHLGETAKWQKIMAEAPPLNQRRPVIQPLSTGVAVVDLLVPLAEGQRELVIGDRKTGKTQFLRQAMMAHMLNGSIVVYGGIARRVSEVQVMTSYFNSRGLLDRLVRVVSLATEPTAVGYLTPYTAMAIAEYFRDQGKKVLVVLDDLTLHAKMCRELALLNKQPPGRNAYPGDIFYAHSQIMERAGMFATGSITCLPIADTVMGDLAGYIQTNLMSMTDGHLFFDRDLFNQGRRPPVNVFLSVSRVGRQTQTPLLRSLSQELLKFMSQYERLKKLTHFGAELSAEVKQTLALGRQLTTFFDQTEDLVMPLNVMALSVAAIYNQLWAALKPEEMTEQVRNLVKNYVNEDQVKAKFDGLLSNAQDFGQLLSAVKQQPEGLVPKATT